MTTSTNTAGFQTRLDTIRSEIDQIQTQVADDVTQTTAQVSSLLQDALETLAKLATVISGDFDHRPSVEPRPEIDLLTALIGQCDAIHNSTVTALTKIGDDHAKVPETILLLNRVKLALFVV